jgi:hypothetical protein
VKADRKRGRKGGRNHATTTTAPTMGGM